MTKSTITREQLLEIIETDHVQCGEASYLARMALGAMDSEPVVPDQMLCEFYEVANWPDLVRELVKHVEQLQDSARRNVKPWEDTFPETLLPAYIERVKQADDVCRAAMLAPAPQEVKGD